LNPEVIAHIGLYTCRSDDTGSWYAETAYVSVPTWFRGLLYLWCRCITIYSQCIQAYYYLCLMPKIETWEIVPFPSYLIWFYLCLWYDVALQFGFYLCFCKTLIYVQWVGHVVNLGWKISKITVHGRVTLFKPFGELKRS